MRKFFAIVTAVLLSVVSANAQYKMKVTLKNGQETEYKVSEIENVTWLEESVTPGDPDGVHNGHEYVDLGFLVGGIKWATCNVGASSPEDYGDYYAWGETETKDTYDWSMYKWCLGSYDTLTKYRTTAESGYGPVDDKTVLEPEDDVAHVKWGGSWRMPTDEEWTALREKCVWTWITKNGTEGYKVTSKSNGNSIFLPFAGYRYENLLYNVGWCGFYWSASLAKSHPRDALNLYLDSSDVSRSGDFDRCHGLSVRPVCCP